VAQKRDRLVGRSRTFVVYIHTTTTGSTNTNTTTWHSQRSVCATYGAR
jgi:hypothetical protein